MSRLKNLKSGVALHTARSSVFNVDAGAGTKESSVIIVPAQPITITRAWVIPDVATIASGGSTATAKIGTAVDGESEILVAGHAERGVVRRPGECRAGKQAHEREKGDRLSMVHHVSPPPGNRQRRSPAENVNIPDEELRGLRGVISIAKFRTGKIPLPRRASRLHF